MSYRACFARLLCATLLFCVAGSTLGFAAGNRDRTQTGQNITVGPTEETGELTCFGCSIRVRGHVLGDATAFGGSIILEDQGQIDGDATVFAGSIRLDKEAKIRGDVAAFGGRVHRDPTATIGGDTANFGGPLWIFLIFLLPLALLGAFVALLIWIVRRLMRPSVPIAA